jgi:hypothetical protein
MQCWQRCQPLVELDLVQPQSFFLLALETVEPLAKPLNVVAAKRLAEAEEYMQAELCTLLRLPQVESLPGFLADWFRRERLDLY